MARGPQPLELEVHRKGRREDAFQATGDLSDFAWMQGELRKWLTGKKWHQDRWTEFELLVRPAGTWDKPVKVRA